MDTTDQIFDRACSAWGFGPRLAGHVRESPIFTDRAKLANTWISSIRSLKTVKNLGTVHFDFIENPTFNAAADVRDKVGIIGMLAGAVLLPFDFFNRLLSHPEVAPHIGDPSNEALSPHHKEPLVQNVNEAIHARIREGRSIGGPAPKDPARKIFAAIAAKIGFDFLFTHELVHIVNGHVGYLWHSCGLPYLIELTSTSVPAAHDPLTK